MKYITLIFSLAIFTVKAQVGIKTVTPESTLDIRAENHLGSVSASDGVLVPRVTDFSIAGGTNGQLVFLNAPWTDDNGTPADSTDDIIYTTGFHYWSTTNTRWQAIDFNKWSKSGDFISSSNFIGTLNNQPFSIRVNNMQMGNLATTGGVGFGFGSDATATNTIAIGRNTIARQDAIAIGNTAVNTGNEGISIGRNTFSQFRNTAIGYNAESRGNNSIALGSETRASGDNSIAIGYRATQTGGSRSVAMGENATTAGDRSVAIGVSANTVQNNNIAIGRDATALELGAVAMGWNSDANNVFSTAIGYNTNATNGNATAIGASANATGFSSSAFGTESQATAVNAVAIGRSAVASQANTVILGSNNTGTRIGIGTSTPAATLQVTGEPTDSNVLDGIIPPSLTGDELAAKTYGAAQNGAIIVVTAAAGILTGQVTNVNTPGLYAFSANQNRWVRMVAL